MIKISDESYLARIQAFRDARDKRFGAGQRSWLALTGLFRLENGDNPFGAEGDNKIVLAQSGQAHYGSLLLEDGQIKLIPLEKTDLTVNDIPAQRCDLHTDQDEVPSLMRAGSLTMLIIERSKGYYLRIWDTKSPPFMQFKGLRYFPIKAEYRIEADFVAYDPPKPITIQDALGGEQRGILVGEAHFCLGGIDCRLVAEEDGDEFLFSFTDQTNADTTYPGGRLLTTDKPHDDRLILDFNCAVNWPCAYTSYATCPVPLAENRLPVRIEAGETRYSEH